MNDLKGLRILNTRPFGQNTQLSKMIREAGGIPIELPAIEIEPISITKHSNHLARIDQIIFTSSNAIHHYFTHSTHIPSNIIITTIGRASALTLKQYDVLAHHIPVIENSESLLQMPHFQSIQNQIILLVKGVGGRRLITKTLKKRGAMVKILNTYRRILPKIEKNHTQFLWQHDAFDIILFTSQEAMYNLFKLFGEQAIPWLCSKPCVVISERLANVARQFGMQMVIVLHLKEGINALVHHIKGRMHDNEPSS